jgi:ABC-type polysaccharide/polyol phosphate transport system ATPase subunit
MIRSFCHRAIWLDHGQLIQDGPAADVTEAYLNFVNHPELGLPPHHSPPVHVLRRA